MTKEIWINLPVKDINRSKAFFTKLGFSFNEQRSNAELASLVIGDKRLAVNLFKDSTFEKCSQNKIADTNQATEVLFAVGAESREEVDDMLRDAVGAGGKGLSEAQEKDGWMYGCGFAGLPLSDTMQNLFSSGRRQVIVTTSVALVLANPRYSRL
jgi:predicted lactoylglutathione lyase